MSPLTIYICQACAVSCDDCVAAVKPAAVIPTDAPEGATADASFGSDAKETQKLRFSFRYAPWIDVLKLFADSADLSLDLNAVPPGTFSYHDKKEYTPTEALASTKSAKPVSTTKSGKPSRCCCPCKP